MLTQQVEEYARVPGKKQLNAPEQLQAEFLLDGIVKLRQVAPVFGGKRPHLRPCQLRFRHLAVGRLRFFLFRLLDVTVGFFLLGHVINIMQPLRPLVHLETKFKPGPRSCLGGGFVCDFGQFGVG